MKNNLLIIHTDGGSRGNPGPAACAFVAEIDQHIIEKQSKYLGVSTNNKAEYEGVILALNWLDKNKTRFIKEKKFDITFIMDSELVVRQLNGLYKIKNSDLRLLNLKINKLIKEININVVFKHVSRNQNKTSDLLVNKELDKQK